MGLKRENAGAEWELKLLSQIFDSRNIVWTKRCFTAFGWYCGYRNYVLTFMSFGLNA